MEYHINIQGLTHLPSWERVKECFEEADPASVLDYDERSTVPKWRINTYLSKNDIQALFCDLGVPLENARIEQQPSICCGGCSG